MPMLSEAQFDARYPEHPHPSATVLALIEDAEAILVDIVGDTGVTDGWAASGAPPLVVPAIVAMVRRAADNPHGFSSERVQEYSYSGATRGGVLPTAREARLIRRAAGQTSVRSIPLEGEGVPGLDAERGATSPGYRFEPAP